MARDLPGSVVNSMRVLGLIVATAGVITLLIWWMRDEVILGWAEGNPSAQEILAQGNMEYPAVPGAPMHPLLRSMGEFRAEGIEPLRDPARAAQALQIMQRSGWR